MDDGVDARKRGVEGVRVADVALDELGVDAGQVRLGRRWTVVEHANPVAARDQPADQRRAHEPGAAGDQDPAFLLHGESSCPAITAWRPTARFRPGGRTGATRVSRV